MFDQAELAAWIRSLGLAVDEPLRWDRIGLGQSNLTFRLTDAAQRQWVLRRPPLGRLLASAHDVAREARILAALRGVPVPRVYGYTEQLVLMEYVGGLVIDTMEVAHSLASQRRHRIGLSLVRTLAQIHAVDLDSTGLVNLASHKPYAQRQLKRWSIQWGESKTRDLPALDELTARLREAAPEQRELTLVHGDFHLRNVIISGESVAAALDWELCTLGDPLADVGSLLAYWPEPGENVVGDFAPSVLPGFPSRDELVRAYLEQTGRSAETIGFWHALGLWKIAIIGEGVLRRALDEPRNAAASGTPTPAQIELLVDRAAEILEEHT
ncbi:phosphotransferase family protein [Nonomuraea lactucae]|uniref:phosphotransferase family protein n=1 Tax=Nonomuraea lactucae TaxID=2249762 RepID=UPI000DE1B3C2|nr:phosphotransferase family protein [Nonomuraea lactucae]